MAWGACSATRACTRACPWQPGWSVWTCCWSTSKPCPAPRHISLIRCRYRPYFTRSGEEVAMRFAGKIALVTGSSRGIGRAIALRLAQDGADVVVHYRRQTAAAQETAAAITTLGRHALIVQADLGEAAAVRQMFTQVRETCGGLDMLV